MLDSTFLICFNFPPRLVVRELDMSLACPEAIWQAGSAGECLSMIKVWTSHSLYRDNLSLHQSLEILCGSDFSKQHRDYFADSGDLNLLLLALGKAFPSFSLNCFRFLE